MVSLKTARRLISYDELPPWSHDNDFIRRGYRAPGGTRDSLRGTRLRPAEGRASDSSQGDPSHRRRQKIDTRGCEKDVAEELIEEHDSFWRCWQSVWMYAHNESVNIHTHLWGAFVAIISVALHVLGALDRLPTWLHPITHHAIFYPAAIVPSLSHSSSSTSWRGLLPFAPQASHVPSTPSQLLSSLLLTPASHLSLYPWHHALRARPNGWSDWLAFASYLAGAITVLGCSATFHTVACHSQPVARTYNKLDYVGIVAMIVGSFLPMVHYGFYCHPRLQLMYSVMILSLGAAAAYTVLSRKFTSSAYRPIRTAVFIALGLSAVIPVTHILAMYGSHAVSRTMGLNYLVGGGALYIVGACLYMARVPERFAPGTFDYLGASHQLFHILILFAAFCHYVCVRRGHIFWHTVEALAGDKHAQGATQAVCIAFDTIRQR